jgi:hypothetical protein
VHASLSVHQRSAAVYYHDLKQLIFLLSSLSLSLSLYIPKSINLLHSVVRARFLFCSSATVSEPNVEVTARPARPSHLNLQNPVRPPSPPPACTAEDGVATTAGAAEPRESAHTAPEGNNTIHSGFACPFYFVFV